MRGFITVDGWRGATLRECRPAEEESGCALQETVIIGAGAAGLAAAAELVANGQRVTVLEARIAWAGGSLRRARREPRCRWSWVRNSSMANRPTCCAGSRSRSTWRLTQAASTGRRRVVSCVEPTVSSIGSNASSESLRRSIAISRLPISSSITAARSRCRSGSSRYAWSKASTRPDSDDHWFEQYWLDYRWDGRRHRPREPAAFRAPRRQAPRTTRSAPSTSSIRFG